MAVDQSLPQEALSSADSTPARAVAPVSSVIDAWILRIALAPVDIILRFIAPRYRLFFWVIAHTPPPVLAALGRWRAERAFDHATRRVPAYRRFVAEAEARPTTIGRRVAPETDKTAYVAAYPIDERCLDGRLPTDSVTIDESSGSSGQPFNWIRANRERAASHVFVSHFARYCFGSKPTITINAFSMGAWATGINMGVAMERNTIVKSTGPDPDKIFRTLEFLGTHRRYLICGYPPFLRQLISLAEARGFPLRSYRLMGLVGGEGMTEGLRDNLSPVFDPIYSGYGATDVEIGIAGETPLSVAIRRLAGENNEIRSAMFGSDSRLPMLFQYNPLSHHITVNDEGELIFTISRLDVLAPRIGYNIHDRGGVASHDDMEETLQRNGIEISDLAPGSRHVPLPFMWIHGRSDYTISVMGANIYPEDLEEALYRCPDLAARTNSFLLTSAENPDGTITPMFVFEIHGEIDEALQKTFDDQIPARVEEINADVRAAVKENPAAMRPTIELHPLGTGPFTADLTKIKQTRFRAPS